MRTHNRAELIAKEISDIPTNPQYQILGLQDEWLLRFRLHCRRNELWYLMQLDLQEYNMEPPILKVIDPKTDLPTKDRSKWPPHPFTNAADHPILHGPWCCMLGLWEFHVHPLDKHHPWDRERNFRSLADLLARLAVRVNEEPPPPPNLVTKGFRIIRGVKPAAS